MMSNDEKLLTLDALNSLNDKERQLALEILKQYAEDGQSDILDQLKYADFDEIPVDIETFMHEPKYLGKALTDQEGRFTVFPYWENCLKDIFPDNLTTKYNNIVFTGAIGLGKAQPLSSLVLTEDGYKEMGELTLDDMVYGNDGRPHKIIGIFPQGKKKVCKVSFTDGTSTLCCDEHLWTVRDGSSGEWKVTETKRLIENGFVDGRYEIPMTKPVKFAEARPYDWLSDSIRRRVKYVDEWLSEAAYENGFRFPNDHEYVNFRDGLRFLIQSLGGTCAFKDDGEWTYVDARLPKKIRKRLSSKLPDEDPHRRISNIEYLEDDYCQCIMIDSEDHLYLTNDFIVTHNSTIAVICLLYMLYRLLCLKDPYLYYGLQPIDKITISLMNITLENAKGVALDKMNQMILASDWFLAHGTMGGTTNLIYRPEKHIEFVTASSNNQIIGRAIFCLDGETEIATLTGNHKLKDLVDRPINVISVDESGNRQLSAPCTVKPTIKTDQEHQIELEDGTIIKCTPEHRLMLVDGTYKMAKDLAADDELAGRPDNLIVKKVTVVGLAEPKQYYDVIEAAPYNNFLIKTASGYIVSHNCNFTDECNFGIVANPEKQKKRMLKLITQIDARMKSRFMRGTYLPTLNILASSKDTEQSFLESYIATKQETESKNTLIVDEPQWVVDSRKDSPEKFWVGIGNKFLANELLPLDVTEGELAEYRTKGYELWQVPIGYLDTFQQNLDEAICSIIGIATASSLKYISGEKINQVKTDSYRNPFVKDVIEVGNAPDDLLQYSNFFDMSMVNEEDLAKPLFVHLDMSLSGDKTGIAGVWITGKEANVKALPAPGNTAMALEPTTADESAGADLHFKLAFSVSVKAPKGAQVSFAKNRNFIRWLRDQGFAVKNVSTDTFQASNLQQDLTSEGFKTGIISVDRLVKDANGKPLCLPYHYLKTAIYERRVTMYQKCDLLTDELIGLERKSDGHVDHTKAGINCLSGDTLVSLTDGREVSMEQLVQEYDEGKENFVYSINHETGRIEPRKIEKAWCSGESNDLAKVYIDNGTSIVCTANHRFMLLDGSYRMAKDLRDGDCLRTLLPAYGQKAVRMVEKLDERRKVYDLTIQANPNFALSNGVFVHNSKDQSDAFCGAVWAAGQFADEYSYQYGESLAAALDANAAEENDNYKRQKMLTDVEEVLAQISMDYDRAQEVKTKKQREDAQYYRDLIDGIIII